MVGCQLLLIKQTALGCLQILGSTLMQHRGCAVVAADVIVNRPDGKLLVDEGYCQVVLQGLEFLPFEPMVADGDVAADVEFAVAEFAGSEPLHPGVSAMQGRPEK